MWWYSNIESIGRKIQYLLSFEDVKYYVRWNPNPDTRLKQITSTAYDTSLYINTFLIFSDHKRNGLTKGTNLQVLPEYEKPSQKEVKCS